MPPLSDLHRAVQLTLAGKRLGKPVFVRYTLDGVAKPEAMVPALARAAAAVREWLGQPLESVYALGAVAAGQVSLTLRFRDGATALVSASRSPARGDGLDLMVIGNRGALYHDSGGASLWDEPAAAADSPDAALSELIERALRSGKPERV
jgi:predicted dehydrogenase